MRHYNALHKRARIAAFRFRWLVFAMNGVDTRPGLVGVLLGDDRGPLHERFSERERLSAMVDALVEAET